MSPKRDKHRVVHDILKAIREKNGTIKPTHILYRANLSHQMMDEYLRDLISKEFIIEKVGDRGKTYELTPRGFEYLGKYKMITEFIDSFGLD